MSTPLGCNYEAPTFGAGYPDGRCFKGFMWDLDSASEPGALLLSGGDIPCPHCNTREYIEWTGMSFSGNAGQRRKAARALVKKVRGWAVARASFPPANAAGVTT